MELDPGSVDSEEKSNSGTAAMKSSSGAGASLSFKEPLDKSSTKGATSAVKPSQKAQRLCSHNSKNSS